MLMLCPSPIVAMNLLPAQVLAVLPDLASCLFSVINVRFHLRRFLVPGFQSALKVDIVAFS
jgi:hypothetical protein